jgi:hypothetical protein
MNKKMIKYKTNKYKNVWTVCHQGHNHQSKKESKYCDTLELLKKAKEIREYDSQYKVELYCDGKLICYHIVDFMVNIKGDFFEVHEVKSKATMTAAWKIKKKLFEVNYPNIKYIIIDK